MFPDIEQFKRDEMEWDTRYDDEWEEVDPEYDYKCVNCNGVDVSVMSKLLYMETREQPAEYLNTITCNNCGHVTDAG
jgi:DNA-directed RNA polymerase subunit RPC12/RpoP